MAAIPRLSDDQRKDFLKPELPLLQDLEEAVEEAHASSGGTDEGMAPVYGMNAKMPDRSIVGEFLTAYQDALLSI